MRKAAALRCPGCKLRANSEQRVTSIATGVRGPAPDSSTKASPTSRRGPSASLCGRGRDRVSRYSAEVAYDPSARRRRVARHPSAAKRRMIVRRPCIDPVLSSDSLRPAACRGFSRADLLIIAFDDLPKSGPGESKPEFEALRIATRYQHCLAGNPGTWATRHAGPSDTMTRPLPLRRSHGASQRSQDLPSRPPVTGGHEPRNCAPCGPHANENNRRPLGRFRAQKTS